MLNVFRAAASVPFFFPASCTSHCWFPDTDPGAGACPEEVPRLRSGLFTANSALQQRLRHGTHGVVCLVQIPCGAFGFLCLSPSAACSRRDSSFSRAQDGSEAAQEPLPGLFLTESLSLEQFPSSASTNSMFQPGPALAQLCRGMGGVKPGRETPWG